MATSWKLLQKLYQTQSCIYFHKASLKKAGVNPECVVEVNVFFV